MRLVLAILALTAAAPAAQAQWQETYPVIRIGIIGGDNLALARMRAEPLRSYLADTLGVSVEVHAAADYGALIADQLTGRYHATFLTASAFVAASAACDGCVQPLAVPTTATGEPGYRAALIVRGDSLIADPDDLTGQRLAVSAEDSLAGRLLPLALFQADGVDLTTFELVERSNPAAAVQALADNADADVDGAVTRDADAALGWVGLGDDPSARGVLSPMMIPNGITIDDATVVWTSPMIPHGPFTVLVSLPSDLKADLAEAIVLLPETEYAASAGVSGGLAGGFTPINADVFLPLSILVDPAFESPR